MHQYSKIVQRLFEVQEFLDEPRSDLVAFGRVWEKFRQLFFCQSFLLMGLYAEMVVAEKLEKDGHDVYSPGLKGYADPVYWEEALTPQALSVGRADLYLRDLEQWVEVKISKANTSPEGERYNKRRSFFLWTWNHLKIRENADNNCFTFLVLVGIPCLNNYLAKPESLSYWVLDWQEASQIDIMGDEDFERRNWFYLADDPKKIGGIEEIPWSYQVDEERRTFARRQYERCRDWSTNPNFRVTYNEKWAKIR